MTNRALVRRPGPQLAAGLVTHIEREPVDVELAQQQWLAYVDVLNSTGWSTVEVPPADDCPDAVFVEDAVVMVGSLAVVTNPGADVRKPEIVAVERLLVELGFDIARITPPATLDGGDVLKVGRTAYVGVGGRTNPAGIRQLGELLAAHGVEVIGVPVSKALHLKSAVTALPDGTVVGYSPIVDDPSVFDRFLAVPEESGAHVVLLGDDRLLMAAGAPETAVLFSGLGYSPIVVDISEFEKLEGCVTCLSVRLRS